MANDKILPTLQGSGEVINPHSARLLQEAADVASAERRAELGTASVTKEDQATTADSPAAASGGLVEISRIVFQTPGVRTELDPLLDARATTGLVTAMVGGETIVIPPASPELLYEIHERSAFLAPIIEAISINVYETGFVIEPIINPDDPDDREAVRIALLVEKTGAKVQQAGDDVIISGGLAGMEVTDKELDATLQSIRLRAAWEHTMCEAFYATCSPDRPYADTQRLTGQDLEITGNAYWELLRDSSRRPSRLVWASARTIRATVQDSTLINCLVRARLSPLRWGAVAQRRRFRRYVQLQAGSVLCRFREYGDPRLLHRLAGPYFNTPEEFQEWQDRGRRPDGMAQLATEMLHHQIPYAGNPVYGMPCYTGTYPAMVGSRELDEENRLIASDSLIPNLLLLISGGRMDGADIKMLRDDILNRKAGAKQLLIIQARGDKSTLAGPATAPTVKVERTKSEQTTDALFQKYDMRNEDKVHGAFRMPRALLGKDLGQNRATTVAMLRFAEDQVFAPRRARLDEMHNERLLPELGAHWVRYRTATRVPSDPETLASIVKSAMHALTPNETRDIIGRPVFERRLGSLPGLWADLPPPVLTALLQTKNQAVAAAVTASGPEARQILARALAAPVASTSPKLELESPAPPAEDGVAKKDEVVSSEEDGGKDAREALREDTTTGE